jgi:hypothetical protein
MGRGREVGECTWLGDGHVFDADGEVGAALLDAACFAELGDFGLGGAVGLAVGRDFWHGAGGET